MITPDKDVGTVVAHLELVFAKHRTAEDVIAAKVPFPRTSMKRFASRLGSHTPAQHFFSSQRDGKENHSNSQKK